MNVQDPVARPLVAGEVQAMTKWLKGGVLHVLDDASDQWQQSYPCALSGSALGKGADGCFGMCESPARILLVRLLSVGALLNITICARLFAAHQS